MNAEEKEAADRMRLHRYRAAVMRGLRAKADRSSKPEVLYEAAREMDAMLNELVDARRAITRKDEALRELRRQLFGEMRPDWKQVGELIDKALEAK